MSTIGIYDSGIGGLSTLLELQKLLPRSDYFYFADNANMPFGGKCIDDMKALSLLAEKRLTANADVCVFACNTASSVCENADVFKVLPDLESSVPENTLVVATPLTIFLSGANSKLFNTLDTASLATLVEIQAAISFKRRVYYFDDIEDYVRRRLSDLHHQIDKVLLGCTHYTFVKHLFESNLPQTVQIDDGNSRLALSVAQSVVDCGRSTLRFEFSGVNEEDKYRWLLHNMSNNTISNALKPKTTR